MIAEKIPELQQLSREQKQLLADELRDDKLPELLQEEFSDLALQWYADTAKESFAHRMAMHPAYQRIIGMGPRALPMVLRELRQSRDHWLWALTAISGANPVPNSEATFDQAVDAWLKWGEEQGYLQ